MCNVCGIENGSSDYNNNAMLLLTFASALRVLL